MLTFALRRAAFISSKVCFTQRCWSSTFPILSKTTSSCFFSPAGLSFLQPRPASRGPTFLACTHLIHSSAAHLKKRPQPEPPPRELDLLRYDMKDLPNSPKPALYLGLSGLLPFACPTLFMAMTENFIPELAYAQVAYGASILSFLGGARWGFALPPSSQAKPDWINLSNSVVPSLLAWVTMLMGNIVSATTMLILGLGIALHYDLALLPTYPSWFKALRAILTIVAAMSLTGMLFVYWICPEKSLFPKEKDE